MSQPKKIYTVSNLNIVLSLWSISGIVDRIQPLHGRVFGRSGLERLSRPDLRLWGQRVWPLGPPPPAGVQQLHHQDGLDAGVTDGAGHRHSWLHQGLRSWVRRPQPSVLLPGAQRKSPGRDSGHLRRLKVRHYHVNGRAHLFPVPQPGLVTNSTFFCFLFVKSHWFAWRANQWPLVGETLFSSVPPSNSLVSVSESLEGIYSPTETLEGIYSPIPLDFNLQPVDWRYFLALDAAALFVVIVVAKECCK